MAKASSRPTVRSSSGRASTPDARPRTSSSSTSRRAATRSGGAQSTGRSPRRTTTACAPASSAYAASKDLYSQDCFIGAATAHRRALRVYTETAWASIFARNLFRRPTPDQLHRFVPNFTIICVPSFQADPETEGTRTGTAILVHLRRMEIIIVGTEYAGEIKKSAFTVMNYLMPDEGVLPMHSAINIGQDGDAAVFFGLSGTGKTTLSADPLRSLIGDDEHGWGDGVSFNFEGGCYAKTIRLSPMYEPDIFQTTRRFGTVLENVDLDPRTRALDLDSERFTENTRGAYPLEFIGNADETGIAGTSACGHLPDGRRVRRPAADLEADPRAGRLPLHQRLHRQACRHGGRDQGAEGDLLGLLRSPVHAAPSGRVRGDAGASDSSATTSPSGWSTPAGPAVRIGVGQRMNIAHTRSMVRAALDGSLDAIERRIDPNFGVAVPLSCPDVPASFLDPRATWADGAAYDAAAKRLTAMFRENFADYADGVSAAIAAAGPGAG